ncbi:MAG: topoisomerase 1, partial [Planctomycetota bacterium]|jgi:DNA topoisomerase-1
VKFVVRLDKKDKIVLPTPPAMQDPDIVCPKCGKVCNIRDGKRGPWLGCSGFPKCRGRGDWKALGEARQAELVAALARHAAENAPPVLRRRDGRTIDGGTPVADLVLPESIVTLPDHPDAATPLAPGAEGTRSPYRAAEEIARRVLAAG